MVNLISWRGIILENEVAVQNAADTPPTQARLHSLDALRGFDMFWIVGGASLVTGLLSFFGDSSAGQLRHAAWHGFTIIDLVMPMFLFIAGVSMPFSLSRYMAKGVPISKINIKIIKRGVILIILGGIYNGMLKLNLTETRFLSVLGFIGISGMLAGFIFVRTNWRGQLAWCVGLMLGYWAAVSWISVPGYGRGDLSMAGNIIGHIDSVFAPGKLLHGFFDPEGLFATISGTCVVLLGALTGELLQHAKSKSEQLKTAGYLAAIGLGCVLLAVIWNTVFPINKQLWTGSFVLLTSGLSMLFLSIFYVIIDIYGYQKWAFIFVLIGLNPITIYLGVEVINFQHTSSYLFSGLISMFGAEHKAYLRPLFLLTTEITFLYLLYRKKIFLRI